jgi:hypothetical protein
MFDDFTSTYISSVFCAYLLAGTAKDLQSSVRISKKELAAALRECSTDLSFLAQRRQLSAGVSEGKIAGVLLFRLCQRRIVHLNDEACDLPSYLTIQERAAISTVLEMLNIDINYNRLSAEIGTHRDPSKPGKVLQDLKRELLFLIKTRHCNQENLGIFFDALCYLDAGIGVIGDLRTTGSH